MLSEKVLFALNNTDDSFLEEAWELLSGSVVSQKPAMRKIIRTVLSLSLFRSSCKRHQVRWNCLQ